MFENLCMENHKTFLREIMEDLINGESFTVLKVQYFKVVTSF